MVARRISGVSDGFVDFFFLGAGVFWADAFFFFFPFSVVSVALDFFGFGWLEASGVSLGVADGSESFVDGFLLFDFVVTSGVSPGFADASDSSVADFFDFALFFGDANGEGEVTFFFLCGDAFNFGEGVGVLSLPVESTALAFRIGLSSSVCCA